MCHPCQRIDIAGTRQKVDIGMLMTVRNRDHTGPDVGLDMRRTDDFATRATNEYLLPVLDSGSGRIRGVKQYIGG